MYNFEEFRHVVGRVRERLNGIAREEKRTFAREELGFSERRSNETSALFDSFDKRCGRTLRPSELRPALRRLVHGTAAAERAAAQRPPGLPASGPGAKGPAGGSRVKAVLEELERELPDSESALEVDFTGFLRLLTWLGDAEAHAQ